MLQEKEERLLRNRKVLVVAEQPRLKRLEEVEKKETERKRKKEKKKVMMSPRY
jgi:hypothetical protein